MYTGLLMYNIYVCHEFYFTNLLLQNWYAFASKTIVFEKNVLLIAWK